MTRDPLLIAAVAVALRLPWALFALPAGIVTDRTDRRRLILAMDVVRAVAFAGAGLVLWATLPLPPPPQSGISAVPAFLGLVVAALIVGAAEVFRDNAAQTMLPALVPHDRLEAANGRLWSVELGGNALLGPPLGAALIAFALPLPFVANALAYGFASLIVAGIAGSFRPIRTNDRDWRAELAEGIEFLRNAPLLRTLAWHTGMWNLFSHMVMIALVLHVQENLGLSSATYGLILAAGAVGGITGGLCGEMIVRRIGSARAAQWSLLSSVPCFISVALAPDALSLCLVLAVFEFAGLVWNTVSVATRQRMIPDHLLGRVNSVYRLMAWGMIPMGLLASGLIVRGLDGPLSRDMALAAPFWVAASGILLVSLTRWRALGTGLAAAAGSGHIKDVTA